MNHLDPNVVIALVTGFCGLFGGLLVAIVYSKSNERMAEMKEKSQREFMEKRDQAQQELIVYKIDQLQRSQEKHNKIIERTYKLETDVQVLAERCDDIIDRVEKLEK